VINFTGGAVKPLLASSQRDSGVRRTGLPFRHRFRGLPHNNTLMLPETFQSRPSGSNSCETDHGIATYNAQLHVIYFARRSRSEAGAILFASHRQTRSPASRFIFQSAVVLVVAFACGLASQTAKAQLRFGIGVGGIGGGIGGILLDDSSRRHQSQQNQQYRQQYQRNQQAMESNSTKKTAKARNQKPKKEKTKIAKEQQPKAKPAEPVASAPSTTPLTAAPPPTADNFGD
jgi:hypothetical protein